MPNITGSTRLREIRDAYPNILEVGARTYPDLKKVNTLVWMMVRNWTVEQAASKAGMPVSEAISKVNEIIKQC